MVIVYNTAVGADGDIDAGLLEVPVPFPCDLEQRSCLTPADTLLFAGNADAASADAYLYKVRTALRKEAEAVGIDDVARADLDAVAVLFADIVYGYLLPFREALGGVDAEHVHACLNELGYTLRIVARVDACADHVAFVAVDALQRIGLMG